MKLHYSQTYIRMIIAHPRFYYLMKLHYSQTDPTTAGIGDSVLLPYEITLLSNIHIIVFHIIKVLLPYEITLLSNGCSPIEANNGFYYLMKLHYSQTSAQTAGSQCRFYYLMKLHYSQTPPSSVCMPLGFTTL